MYQAFAALLTCVLVSGCGSSQSAPATPSEAAPPTPSPAAPSPEPNPGGAAERPQLTAEACETNGGTVVGDIGDGAIHRPDYRCPSGAPPSGSIRAAAGGPIAVEG